MGRRFFKKVYIRKFINMVGKRNFPPFVPLFMGSQKMVSSQIVGQWVVLRVGEQSK